MPKRWHRQGRRPDALQHEECWGCELSGRSNEKEYSPKLHSYENHATQCLRVAGEWKLR